LEFQRAGLTLPLDGLAIVDPMEIFHAYERRDLSAAVRFYLGRDHDGAHSAATDAVAAVEGRACGACHPGGRIPGGSSELIAASLTRGAFAQREPLALLAPVRHLGDDST